MTRIAVVALSALLLAGCSVNSTPTHPAPSASTTPQAEDDMQACAILSLTLTPVVDTVTAIVQDPTGQTLKSASVSDLASQLRSMLKLSTSKMDIYAVPYASVVLELDDIFKGKAPANQVLNTGAYRDAAPKVMSYCVDEVGYRAD